jgi:hypothetical protein
MIGELTTTVILITGAAGEPEYGAAFTVWSERWEMAAARGGGHVLRVASRDELVAALAAEERDGDDPLWVVFVGHGTHAGGDDGLHAKLNLRGPDVSALELSAWLDPIARPTSVVICASSSGPFVNQLSRPGRVVVTATKSGQQYNYSRFGDYLSRAIGDLEADLDKDAQVSLLEAFLFASAGVAEFYEGESRLATEHALIDDNGDGLGTPASWFRGVRSIREAEGDLLADGVHAQRRHLVETERERALSPDLRRKRDELEARLDGLRLLKPELAADDYYTRLERLMLQLARLYEER